MKLNPSNKVFGDKVEMGPHLPAALLGSLGEGTPSLFLPGRRQDLGWGLMPKNKVGQE